MHANDVLDELLRHLGDEPTTSARRPTLEEIERRARARHAQRRRRRAGIGVVAALAAGALYVGSRRDDGHQQVQTASTSVAAPAVSTTLDANGCPPPNSVRPPTGTVDYIPFVQLHGVTYTGFDELPASVHLGAPYATVCRDVSALPGLVDIQDGDAAFLAAGTSVFQIDGHDPRTMVAAELNGRSTLYEADNNPAATTGRDLLDVRSGLSSVRIFDGVSGSQQLGQVTDPAALADLAARIMSAHVDQMTQGAHADEDRWFLELTTADGLTTRRAFWRSTGELQRGIYLDPAAVALLASAVPN